MNENQQSATFVPGRLRCPKCGFVLVRVSLYMLSGTAGPDEGEAPSPCLNCGEQMLPVTWEQEARQAWTDAGRLYDEAQALRGAVQEAYGRLWCVNEEPMAPIPMYPYPVATKAAKMALLGVLTKDQQAEAINSVRNALWSVSGDENGT